MSVTIAGAPVAAADLPAPTPVTEQTLADFAGGLQNGAHLADPAALASELFGGLRGYFDRTQHLEKITRDFHGHQPPEGERVNLAALYVPDDLQAGKTGGPAREDLTPDGADDVSRELRTDAADVERISQLMLESMKVNNESYLLAEEVGQVARSVNTLLKGQ